eukprot:642334-Pelagomonas_calceolata.AAC.1
MQLGSIQQTLRQTTARLTRLEMDPRQKVSRGRYPRSDPRDDPRWPKWGITTDAQLSKCKEERKCLLCFNDGHPWQACPRLKGQRSPFAQSLQEISPSPPGSWRARPCSPPRARPNARGP